MQVLTQLVDRMSDHDERVRAAVVRALGAVGASDPAKLTHAAAQGLCQRVHDAKLSVRREAAAVAVNVFRNLALRLSKGIRVQVVAGDHLKDYSVGTDLLLLCMCYLIPPQWARCQIQWTPRCCASLATWPGSPTVMQTCGQL
jgi:hypothetical protein